MKIPAGFQNAANAITGSGPFAKNWRLTVLALGPLECERGLAVWGDWFRLAAFPDYPQYALEERYRFIDAYLEKLLAPQPHPTRRNYIRPDLNGKGGSQRAWLLNKVLMRLVEEAQPDYQAPPNAHRFPEDLPKVVEDMNLLRLHHAKLPDGPTRTLQHYKTMEALGEAVKEFRPQYPISVDERAEAHRRFLVGTHPLTGEIYKGDGKASLIAVLPDETEVIQVHSEEASRAYGSPRWCTAYRERETYFWDYADDLMIVINPEGERWQAHFRTMQFQDAAGQDIGNIPTFISEHTGLAEALTPALLRQFGDDGLSEQMGEERWDWYFGEDGPGRQQSAGLLLLASVVPVWRDAVRGDNLTKLFQQATELGRLVFLRSALNVVSSHPSWRDAVPASVIVTLLERYKKDGYWGNIELCLRDFKAVPSWRAAVPVEIIPAALKGCAASLTYDTVEGILHIVKDVPFWREATLRLLQEEKTPQKLREKISEIFGNEQPAPEHSIQQSRAKPRFAPSARIC
ncbi:MAG: hypothetical protein SFW62_02240 [Alphaproteobacteria bacterium]|nr:hypothetical protein [Alphaproteobacteria bacterium]